VFQIAELCLRLEKIRAGKYHCELDILGGDFGAYAKRLNLPPESYLKRDKAKIQSGTWKGNGDIK